MAELEQSAVVAVQNGKRGGSKAALFRDFRVFGPERACCGVSGILEQGQSGGFPFFVQRFKYADGHVDFAADDDGGVFRRIGQLFGEIADVHGIGRDVFADAAVASGCSLYQFSVLVNGCHGQAINFVFDSQCNIGQSKTGGLQLVDAGLIPVRDVIGVEHVFQRQQRYGVFDRRLFGRSPSAYMFGGGAVGGVFRVFCLQLMKPFQGRIIGRIRDNGVVIFVIGLVVTLQLFSERQDFSFDVHRFLLFMHGSGNHRHRAVPDLWHS